MKSIMRSDAKQNRIKIIDRGLARREERYPSGGRIHVFL
jgi:hypothetical protein